MVSLLDENKLAVISLHENIKKTFKSFFDDVNKLSDSLATQCNVKRGDVVALWSSNCYKWLVIQYSIAKIGAILCTMNPVYKSSELEYSLKKCNAQSLFLPGFNSPQSSINDFSNLFEEIKSHNLPLKNVIFIDGQEKRMEPFSDFHLDNLISSVNPSQVNSNDVDSDDPAIIMFTSVN